MLAARVLGAFGALLSISACSGESRSPDESSRPATGDQGARASPPPARVPELPLTGERDADGNRLDDVLDRRRLAAGSDPALLAERVRVKVILSAPLEQAVLDQFEADGGKVEYVFRELSYGFVGSLEVGKLDALGARWRDTLHLVAAPSVIVPFLDEATRTGRVRGVWASGFAGSASGYSGGSTTTIAVLDTGVDQHHPDLASRMQGWADYTPDAAAEPRDVSGHGTHVAAVALGSGQSFGAVAGTLRYTQSGSLAGISPGAFVSSPLHTPGYLGSGAALSVSAQASFAGGGSGRLAALTTPDGSSSYSSFGSVTGGTPLSLSNQNGGAAGGIYQGALIQADPPTLTSFAVVNSVANYPAVGDGFNTLRGVAPSCWWFGGKVLRDSGSSSSLDVSIGLDDLASRRVADGIKIVNLSLGVAGSGVDTVLRAAVNSAVDAGMVVVVAAGNDFPQTIGDPGRAAKVITVGATNDLNQLTNYTSIGATSAGNDEDWKPDLLAPGGSAYRSQILAADTGTGDGDGGEMADLVADDYANLKGTSMSAPFVSGAVALMIDALEQGGAAWSFGSSAQPLLLKMLLAASATELGAAREQGSGQDPALGRAATPKDRFEGYGIVNPDAAIEALRSSFVSPLNGSVGSAPPARLEWERRAWGRNVDLVNGATVLLNLSVSATADYDVYLYAGAPDAKGNPVLRASSTGAGLGADETISFVSAATETAYLFVKRVSGHGAFSLTGSAVSHCGDGKLDTGELCDPAVAGSGACCTATCTFVTDGAGCDDGDACTLDDRCVAGACQPEANVVCPAPSDCHEAGACNSQSGACSVVQKLDGSPCGVQGGCQNGFCVEPSGEGGAGGQGVGEAGAGGEATVDPSGGSGGDSSGGAGAEGGVAGAEGNDGGAGAEGGATGQAGDGGVAGGPGGGSGSGLAGRGGSSLGGDGGISTAGTAGGASAGSGGARRPNPGGGASPEPSPSASSATSSGCGCSVPGGSRLRPELLSIVLALQLLRRRRRSDRGKAR